DIGKQLVVSRHPHHIGVPGDHPQFVLVVPVDGVLFPEAAIIRIGIGDHVVGKHIIVHCHHRHTLSSSVSQVWSSALPHALALSTGASRRQGPAAHAVDRGGRACHGTATCPARRSGSGRTCRVSWGAICTAPRAQCS